VVVISDEMGSADGVGEIVSRLKKAGVMTYVLGVSGGSGAHEAIAKGTRGKFWDINQSKGAQDFGELFSDVAETIGRRSQSSSRTDAYRVELIWAPALRLASEELAIPPMPGRALPPVIVLTSDGRPTDDFDAGLNALMNQPWGRNRFVSRSRLVETLTQEFSRSFLGMPSLSLSNRTTQTLSASYSVGLDGRS